MSARIHRYSVVSASDNSVAYLPNNWKGDGTKTGVVFQCGLSDYTLNTAYDTNKAEPLMEALTAAGFPVVMTDLGAGATGGTPQWGNANAISKYAAARTYLQGTLGAKAGKIVASGFSMGGVGSLNWAAANPTQVAAIAGFCPVTNITVFRGAGIASIDTAYGAVFHNSSVVVTSGSGVISDPLAASGDVGKIINSGVFNSAIPLDSTVGSVVAGTSYTLANGAVATANGTNLNVGGWQPSIYGATNNPATIAAAGGYGTIPCRFYTASNDTTAPTSAVPAIVTAIGASAAQVDMGALGHSYAVPTAAAAQFVTWLQSLGL